MPWGAIIGAAISVIGGAIIGGKSADRAEAEAQRSREVLASRSLADTYAAISTADAQEKAAIALAESQAERTGRIETLTEALAAADRNAQMAASGRVKQPDRLPADFWKSALLGVGIWAISKGKG